MPADAPSCLSRRARVAGVLLLLAAGALLASPVWQVHGFDGIPTTAFRTDGGGVVRILADGSAGLYYRPVDDDEAAGRVLSWRWRVDRAAPPVDITARGGDDRPLAVMVAFPEADDSLLGWMSRGLASLAGMPLQGRCITYVWGGLEAAGTHFRDPYLGDDGYVVVLRPGDTPHGRWFTETVRPQQDYRRLFGEAAASSPAYIAIASDSDHTGTVTRAAVAGL